MRAIREHSVMLTSRLLEKIQELGWPTLTPPDANRRAGTVCLNPPDSQAISRDLLKHDFLTTWRPDAGIRVSPHFYNTVDECDAIVAEIAALSRPAAGTAYDPGPLTRLYDISRPLAPGAWTWPGDTPFACDFVSRRRRARASTSAASP